MKHCTFINDPSINARTHLFITDTEVSVIKAFETHKHGTYASYATFKRGVLGLQLAMHPDHPGYIYNTLGGNKMRCLTYDEAMEVLEVLRKEDEYYA